MNNQKHNKQNNALEQINFSTGEVTTDSTARVEMHHFLSSTLVFTIILRR